MHLRLPMLSLHYFSSSHSVALCHLEPSIRCEFVKLALWINPFPLPSQYHSFTLVIHVTPLQSITFPTALERLIIFLENPKEWAMGLMQHFILFYLSLHFYCKALYKACYLFNIQIIWHSFLVYIIYIFCYLAHWVVWYSVCDHYSPSPTLHSRILFHF